jgi:hypothetical protein
VPVSAPAGLSESLYQRGSNVGVDG